MYSLRKNAQRASLVLISLCALTACYVYPDSGTWHGVGDEERYLLVNESQYRALVKAKVVPKNGSEEPKRGKRSRKPSKS